MPREQQAADDKPQVLMCHGNPWRLGASDKWPFVASNLDVLKIYIGNIPDTPIDQVRTLVGLLQDNDIDIAVELGGLVDWRADDVDPEAGLELTGVTVDNPYRYAIGDHPTNQARAIRGIAFIDRIADLRSICTFAG